MKSNEVSTNNASQLTKSERFSTPVFVADSNFFLMCLSLLAMLEENTDATELAADAAPEALPPAALAAAVDAAPVLFECIVDDDVPMIQTLAILMLSVGEL